MNNIIIMCVFIPFKKPAYTAIQHFAGIISNVIFVTKKMQLYFSMLNGQVSHEYTDIQFSSSRSNLQITELNFSS